MWGCIKGFRDNIKGGMEGGRERKGVHPPPCRNSWIPTKYSHHGVRVRKRVRWLNRQSIFGLID